MGTEKWVTMDAGTRLERFKMKVSPLVKGIDEPVSGLWGNLL